MRGLHDQQIADVALSIPYRSQRLFTTLGATVAATLYIPVRFVSLIPFYREDINA